jgi:hypothetical protein
MRPLPAKETCMTANYCQQCGRKLDAGARFCPVCGTPVGQTRPPGPPAAPPPQTYGPAGGGGANKTLKTVLIVVGLAFLAFFVVGVIAVVGLKFSGNQTHQAMHMQAYDTLRQVQGGMAEYYLKTGNYPELGSWEAMVGPGSPLVKRHMIRVGLPVNDPWGTPYEGRSTKFTFELKCAGRPDKGDDVGPITITQGRVTGAPGTSGTYP